jgi:hypothetical protein
MRGRMERLMAARITITLGENDFVGIHLNEEGRDLLVRELQGLNASNEHLHLAPQGYKMADVELRSQPYRVGDKVLEWGKICFRLDAWDRKHYPHTVD